MIQIHSSRVKHEAVLDAQAVLNRVQKYMESKQSWKFIFLFFWPTLNGNDAELCARCTIEESLKLNNYTLEKVNNVKLALNYPGIVELNILK